MSRQTHENRYVDPCFRSFYVKFVPNVSYQSLNHIAPGICDRRMSAMLFVGPVDHHLRARDVMQVLECAFHSLHGTSSRMD